MFWAHLATNFRVNSQYDTAFDVGIYVNRRMLHCNISAQVFDSRSEVRSPRWPTTIAESRRRMSSEKTTGNLLTPTRRGLLTGAASLSAAAMLPQFARAEAPPTAAGEHHRARRHRHRSHRRHPAFGHRHHGDQRDRLGGGRKARDRADQRARRRARPQDQVHPGRRRQRLADLRREGEEASGAATSAPRCSAAGPRPRARRCCRCSSSTTACSTTRPSTKASSSRRTSSTPARKRPSRSSPA